jgi:3-oxoacyl-[acyl-carrier protein] reductase
VSGARTGVRVAVVTGGGRGIGRGVAERLAEDGNAVAVLDLDRAAAEEVAAGIRDGGGRAVAVETDVADEESVLSAVGQVASALGPPAILVNNAGFARDMPLREMTIDDWDAVQGVHLRGTFLMTRAVADHMVERRWGRIVNISSVSALGDDDRVNYAAAKSGMHGFIRSCALELGPYGVTANIVAPGLIVTDMTIRSAKRAGRSLDEHVRLAAERIPVRRTGRPDDIAHAVSFFAGDASGFITGQVLFVSGGPHG